MSRYRRFFIPGGTCFFTVTLADRSSESLVRNVDLLRRAYGSVQQQRPFRTIAICILPDHLHAIWTLPEGDADFPRRWSLIKGRFARALPATALRTQSKLVRREKGIWQRRYWEHAVRDDDDLSRHIDYTYYNPVSHGLVTRVKDWPHSSFHRDVSIGLLREDWGGDLREQPGRFGEAPITRRVGKAERAHRPGTRDCVGTAHARLCPPYDDRFARAPLCPVPLSAITMIVRTPENAPLPPCPPAPNSPTAPASSSTPSFRLPTASPFPP